MKEPTQLKEEKALHSINIPLGNSSLKIKVANKSSADIQDELFKTVELLQEYRNPTHFKICFPHESEKHQSPWAIANGALRGHLKSMEDEIRLKE